MLNWIKFISIFLLALSIIIVVTIFYSANKPLASAKKAAIEKALDSGQIDTVESAQPYNGIHSVVTIFGVNSDGEKTAVFIDGRTEGAFEEVKLADGITAEAAVEAVREELEVSDVLHVKLGIEEVGAVWEVAFKGGNDKLSYVYVVFEDGQWWKRILNL